MKNNLTNKQYCFNSISNQRNVLMGIAAFTVVLFHSYYMNINFIKVDSLQFLFNTIKTNGNSGVDIFLLLSGLGLYYSLDKNPNIKEFYKRRFLRIIPPIFIVAVLSNAFISHTSDALSFWGNITFVSFFVNGNRLFWYFSFIIILYLVYPVIHKVITQKKIKGFILLMLAAIVFNLFLRFVFPSFYLYTEIAFARLPVFIVGALFGYLSKSDYKCSLAKIVIICSALLIISYCTLYSCKSYLDNHMHLTRLLDGTLAVSYTILFSVIFSKLRLKAIRCFFVFIGIYSMEIYLFYERVVTLTYNKIISDTNIIYFIVVFVITVTSSVLLKLIVEKITSAIKK